MIKVRYTITDEKYNYKCVICWMLDENGEKLWHMLNVIIIQTREIRFSIDAEDIIPRQHTKNNKRRKNLKRISEG